MKLTINLNPETYEQIKNMSQERGMDSDDFVKEALAAGLEGFKSQSEKGKKYRTIPRPMGLRKGLSLDNVRELISQVEGEDSR